MADRNVAGSNTFEQFRVEFNELATDVGDIASITGASGRIASATDVIEAVTAINSQLPTNITFTANEIDVASGDLTIDVAGDITLDMSEEGKAIFNKDIQLNNSGVISNGSVNLSFPTVGGAISTEGFSIALATALG